MTAEDLQEAKRLWCEEHYAIVADREGMIEKEGSILYVSSDVWWLMRAISVGMDAGYQQAVAFHRLTSVPAKFLKE